MATMKKRTGRSADASAGAAAAKKATLKARATGQTKSSAMDAVSRRYKDETTLIKQNGRVYKLVTTMDKRNNNYKSGDAFSGSNSRFSEVTSKNKKKK